MIQLASLAMSYPTSGSGRKVILRSTSITLPTDRRLAVLGAKQESKSGFLRLLAGIENPTQGTVTSHIHLSPIFKYGVLFKRRLSILENIRFFARLMGIDVDMLTIAVDKLCGANGIASVSLEHEEGEQRRIAEIALLSVLPFDCYLVDEIWLLPEVSRQKFFNSAVQRKAGVIFTTNQARLARQYADCAVVIKDGVVHPFSTIDEGIAFYEGG